MARISFDFRNIVGSEKCAVSSPRIVSLEVGDESPGSESESVFQENFLINQICCNGVNKSSNSICGCDKQSDKNFLNYSQSSLSTSTCDDRLSDKIKSANDSDIDRDLLDLLNTAELQRAVKSGVTNFNSEKAVSDDKMKIISNVEVCDGLSNLASSIAHDITEKDEGDSTFEYCQRKKAQDCGIDLLDFEIVKNGCADSLSSNSSSLKVEGNLSDLLSCINIEDADITKVGIINSRNMCNSKVANKSEIKTELPITDLSDLLSSIDLGDSYDNKVGSCNRSNPEVLEAQNELCLADLLSSIDIDKSNKPDSVVLNCNQDNMCNIKALEGKNESCLADILSSINIDKSNKPDSIELNSNRDSICNMKGFEAKNESCLADLLSSIDIDKSNEPSMAVLNNKSLSCGSSNLHFNDTNCISDSLNGFIFDIGSSSSSSNSCASSYSEDEESNSPKDSSTKNNFLTDKIFESDSGYSSFDSTEKGFSFFDYSSDNRFSFNTLLTKKSDASVTVKHSDREDARNSDEEISMSDLMTIVSPEFKNPVLASLNKGKKLEGSVNKDSSGIQDLIECINIKDSHVTSTNLVDCDEKMMSFDCVDGRISKNAQNRMEAIDIKDALLGKDNVSTSRSDFVDDEQITFIDLRECVKSAEAQFTPSSPIKQDKIVENQSSECFSPSKILFYCEDKSPSDSSRNTSNPFEFNDVVPRKKSKVNTKQTLFSKALACKTKKDLTLLQKVANIKNELLNNIIHRPVLIDCDLPQPIVESVIQSDRCILSNAGRKFFGIDATCELQ